MMKTLKIGLLSASLMLSAACSKTEPEVPMIPRQLLNPCAEPAWEGQTNGELIEHIMELREALGKCNADKAAIERLVER